MADRLLFSAAELAAVEVVVNDVRYVPEETLFAAMREVERLQVIAAAAADLVLERPFGSLDQRAFYRLREVLRGK